MDGHGRLPRRSEYGLADGSWCGGGGSGGNGGRERLPAAQGLQLLLTGQLLLKGLQQVAARVHIVSGLPGILLTENNK